MPVENSAGLEARTAVAVENSAGLRPALAVTVQTVWLFSSSKRPQKALESTQFALVSHANSFLHDATLTSTRFKRITIDFRGMLPYFASEGVHHSEQCGPPVRTESDGVGLRPGLKVTVRNGAGLWPALAVTVWPPQPAPRASAQCPLPLSEAWSHI